VSIATLPTAADILSATEIVYAHHRPTPQYAWPLLSQRPGATAWVKHGNHGPVGAFKLRGGLAYLHALERREPRCRGVISATRGNHGQSIALAASRRGSAR
jgi:threonine dehydratase